MGKRLRLRLELVELETRKYMSSMFPNGFQRSWSQTFDKFLTPGRVMGSGFILIPATAATVAP
jgi:hypothetical protein